MTEPLFWLSCSLLLVAVSLTALLAVAIPAVLELAGAARSAEKLFDTLNRELPPTLEAIRMAGVELSDLSGEVNSSVQSAASLVKKVDQGLITAKQQAQQLQTTTMGVMAGVRAAWRVWQRPGDQPKVIAPIVRETIPPVQVSRD